MSRIPLHRVNWKTSVFLIGTFLLSLTAVPWYLWNYGVDTFTVTLFLFLFAASSMSITLGYHRLFSHRAFEAHWLVRFVTLFFGAGAFETMRKIRTISRRASSMPTLAGCSSKSIRRLRSTTSPTCGKTGWSRCSIASFTR
jgi:fatty-acid desaturase